MQRLLVMGAVVLVLGSIAVGLHAYVVLRLARDTASPAPIPALLTVVVALGFVSMWVALVADAAVAQPLARILAWPGALWMGTWFLLVVALVLSDLVLVPSDLLGASWASGPLVARVRAAAVLVVVVVGLIVGLFGALSPPRLARVRLELPRWPASLDGYRVVLLSDLHVGALHDRRFVAAVVERVLALEPDLVVIAGDLVDGPPAKRASDVRDLALLRARDGVFMCAGNHEFISGGRPWLDHFEGLGLRVLANQRVRIGQGKGSFELAGVHDHSGRWFGFPEDLEAALAGRDPDLPVILLAHDPSSWKDAVAAGVDLQLSGHTHGGQVWPFGLAVHMSVGPVAGVYRQGDSTLYVSRGTGFWGPPLRIGAPAEITELTLFTGATGS